MAIDYAIQYACVPRQSLGNDGIVQRLKGKARAETIIRLYRENGDQRPPDQMGFEITRNSADGTEVTETIVVQSLLDAAAALEPLAAHCAGCPANLSGTPFGCTGSINYPLSAAGEIWLLKRLPNIDEPLVWLLLRQGLDDFGYDGNEIADLRASSRTYFEDAQGFSRPLGEFQINSNQVFEMLFMVGDITPNHAAVQVLFFGGMRRDLEADAIMRLTPAAAGSHELFPFLMQPEPDDDATISELKNFFRALWMAWLLNVRVWLDV